MADIQTRVSRFNRLWVCPFCQWRAYVSRRRHFQTGQPLSRDEQIATLRYQASQHFRERHRNDFSEQPRSVDAVDPHADSTGTPSTRDKKSSSSDVGEQHT